MDGTLLNSEKKISKYTAEMIRQAFAAGKEVVLSTGRCAAELEEFQEQIPELRYLICASGAHIYDSREKKTIYAKKIPVSSMKEILKVSRMQETLVQILTTDSIIQASDLERMDLFGIGQYRPMFERIATKVDNIYDYYDKNPVEIEKINVYHTTPEGREQSRERLKKLDLELVNAEAGSLECSAGSVTKGLALGKLCDFLGIPLRQAIAVGDADNDMSALKIAGLSVAMGNANENVKGICDVIVSDCDHDGCAEAIQKYLL